MLMLYINNGIKVELQSKGTEVSKKNCERQQNAEERLLISRNIQSYNIWKLSRAEHQRREKNEEME